MSNTGRAIDQSIVPRRWNITVPTMPVNVNVKSAVAIAVCIGNCANAVSAGIRSTPRYRRADQRADTKAIGNSQARSGIDIC